MVADMPEQSRHMPERLRYRVLRDGTPVGFVGLPLNDDPDAVSTSGFEDADLEGAVLAALRTDWRWAGMPEGGDSVGVSARSVTFDQVTRDLGVTFEPIDE